MACIRRFFRWMFVVLMLMFLVVTFRSETLFTWVFGRTNGNSTFLVSVSYYINSSQGKHLTEKINKQFTAGDTQEQRKAMLQRYCEQAKPLQEKIDYGEGFLYSNKQKLIYCRVAKVACTTWKRVILFLEGKQKSLHEIPDKIIHRYPINRLRNLDEESIEIMKEYYYSFMFSRHPHDRLFSAYRNKFLDPKNRTYYIEFFGPYIVFGDKGSQREIDEYVEKNNINRKNLKVSFEQFVRFILRNSPRLDTHWQPQTDTCKICNFTFNFIGKFETMRADAKTIFEKLNQMDVYNMLSDDTVYTEKTTALLRKFYRQLPKELLPKIYEYYKGDFEAFGYNPYYYI